MEGDDMDLRGLLAHTIEVGGSDLHLKVGEPPVVRVDGDLQRIAGAPELTDYAMEQILGAITAETPAKREQYLEHGNLDTSYTSEGAGRFRVNGFRQRGLTSFAFRYVPKDVPDFDALGLPTGVSRLAEERRGLILVTGAPDSGKTTSLAAMIDHINRTRTEHIVTIEIVHEDKGCIVSQREIGLDTSSFREALCRVLRQNPDVILVGELRDKESATAALQAGESGHLVLSTMHTLDARETIGRMIELFPADKQMLVRQILAATLRGVVSQRLLPRIGGGRVAAVEVMVNTSRISDLIIDPAKTEDIPIAIEEGEFHAMQSFSQHLVDLVMKELVEPEIAAGASGSKHDFEIALAHALRARAAEEAAASGERLHTELGLLEHMRGHGEGLETNGVEPSPDEVEIAS
jgi:twitching motility protein PilT